MVVVIPKITVILVNYNSYSDTLECVHSLKQIDYCKFDIVIVDNGSGDKGLLEKDTYLNETTTILYSKNNGGFSYGNNVGIKYALDKGADYVLLLNNDTIVEPDFLTKLLDCAQKKGACGIVTGQSRYYSRPDEINFRGGKFNYKLGTPEYVDPHVEEEVREDITFATGCLLLIPKSTIIKVGFLDESFFMYGEDTDYCMRVLQAGLKIYYCDDAVIYHKISASSGECSDFKTYYILRNSLYIIKQYGNNQGYAFLRQVYLSAKFIFKGIYKWAPVRRAWTDFLKGKKGRSFIY